jgi:hypothetical protein
VIDRIYIVLLALLVGAQAAVGYLVAPTLFEVISDRSLAGSIAGLMFERMGWLSLAVLLILLVLKLRFSAPPSPSKLSLIILAIMLGLTALGHFIIRPWIAHVRAMIQQSGGFELCAPGMRMQFGVLHGVSSILFLVIFVLGLILLMRVKNEISPSIPKS